MPAETMTPLRRLGNTEIRVSPVGLGMMEFGGGGGLLGAAFPKITQEVKNATVQAALDGGINWFDTAELYGLGVSEASLVAALKSAGKGDDEVVVATKWWPLLRTARNIPHTIGERLRYLDGYSIGLYMVHQPISLSSPEAEMDAMADLVEAGKIRSVGVSNFSAERMRRAHARLARRGLPLAANQVLFSLLERGIERNGILQTAKELGVTIIAYTPLASGLLVGLAWTGLGLVALAWAGTNLNLSRAAQETTHKEKVATAQRYGMTELASQLRLNRRLGVERTPTRLPVRPSEWMLGWKDVLQSWRTFSLSGVWGWLSLLAVSLGVCLVPEMGARGLALAIWAVMVGQRATDRLQKDLAHWSLLRLLPFSSGRLLVADLALPWALVVVLGWFSLVLAGGAWAVSVRLSVAILLPSLGAAVSLAAAFDLLRQVRSDMLLNGSAPQVSSVGGLLGILSLALVLGLWDGLKRYWVAASLSAALLAVLLALVFWHLASRRLQAVE